MTKVKNYSENEKYLKKILKGKISFSQGILVGFLISGILGLSTPAYSAWTVTEPGSGATSAQGAGTQSSSIILAPTSGPKAKENKAAKESVVIGTESYTQESGVTTIGNNAGAVGSQAVAVGQNSIAGKQSVAVGADTYAKGNSSIAIGNDDIEDVYRDSLPESTIRDIYKDLYEGDNPFITKANFDKKYVERNIYSPTYSRGNGAIAIGSRTVAYGNGATALGTLSFALADGSTALGLRSFVSKDALNGVAIGEQSRVFAANSLAVGNKNESSAAGAMSYGYNAKAIGGGSIAIGHTTGANASLTAASQDALIKNLKSFHKDNNNSFLTGANNEIVREGFNNGSSLETVKSKLNEIKKVNYTYNETGDVVLQTGENVQIKKTRKKGDNSIALGSNSFSNGNNSIALGSGLGVFGNNSIGIGSLAYVSDEAPNTVALGVGAYSEKGNNVIIGTSAQSSGGNSVLIGSSATSTADGTIAIGYDSVTSSIQSIGIGRGTRAKSLNSISLGTEAVIEENAMNSIALGTKAVVGENAENSIALGTGAVIKNGAQSSAAFGKDAMVTGDSSIALGNNTKADMDNSVALGFKSTTLYKYDPNAKTAMPVLEDNPAGVDASNQRGYVPDGSSYALPVDSSAGVISVGGWNNNGKVGLRRIINVAPGFLDTDAATVGQLKALSYVKREGNVAYYTEQNGQAMKVVKGDNGKFYAANTVSGEPLKDIEVAPENVFVGAKGTNEGTYTGTDGHTFADMGGKIVFANLKDGKIAEGSDQAVTGNQLYATNKAVAENKTNIQNNTAAIAGNTTNISKNTESIKTLNNNMADVSKSWKIAVNDGNAEKVGFDKTVRFKTDNNLKVETSNADGNNTLTFGLKDNLNIGGISINNVKNADGQTYSSSTITGLTNTTWDKDNVVNNRAATEGQLAAISGSVTTIAENYAKADASNVANNTENVKKWKDALGVSNLDLSYKAEGDATGKTTTLSNGLTFKGDSNITAAAKDSGVVEYSLNSDLTGITSISNKGTGTTITINDDGVSLGNKKLTGIADGELNENSTDAVNGKQLFNTNKAVAVNAADIDSNATRITTNTNNINTNLQNIETNLASIQELQGEVSGKANITLDNINAAGTKVIKAKAIEAIDVKAADNSAVTVTSQNEADKKTFTVGLNEDKIKEITGTTNIGTDYAKADASNVANNTENVKKWKDALGVSNLDLSYKAEGDTTGKTTTLSNGLTFKGDNNITAAAEDGGAVKYSLNSDLKGITSISNKENGTKITLSDSGVDLGNKKLTGIADGTDNSDAVTIKQFKDLGLDPTSAVKKPAVTYDNENKTQVTLGNGTAKVKVTNLQDAELNEDSTDAVTGKQLYNEISSIKNNMGSTELSYKANNGTAQKTTLEKGLNFVNGTNTIAMTNENGVIKFNLSKNLVDIESIKGQGKAVALNKDNVDFGNQRVTGINNGTASSDAVNISQLKPIVNSLGGGAEIGTDGSVTAPTYALKTGNAAAENYNTVGDALNAVDKAIDNSAKIDASNIDKDKYTAKLNEGANIDKPTGALVTDKNVNDFVAKEIGKIDSKIDNMDIGGGTIQEGDNKTVTGDTVNKYLGDNYYNKEQVDNRISAVNNSVGNAGLNISDSNGNEQKVNLKNDKLTFKGDKNISADISVSENGKIKNVTVGLNKDIEVEKVSITTPDAKDPSKNDPSKTVTIEKGNITAGAGDNKIEINGSNGTVAFGEKPSGTDNRLVINGKDKTISNLSEGKNDSDAVTKGQMDKAVAKASSSKLAFTDEQGNRVTETADGKYYKESDVVGGNVKADAKEVKDSEIKTSLVDKKGSTTKPARLGNVAAGTQRTDAVNVEQLEQVRNEVYADLSGVAQEVRHNSDKINRIERSYKKGVANAMATAGVKFQEIDVNEITVGAAVGYYKDQGAVAVGVEGAPTRNLRIHGTISATPGPRPEAAASVGFSWKFKYR